MGSHVWQRDAKKSTGGKTFAVGVPAIVPAPAPPPPKRRKLVWSRQDAAAARDAEAAAPENASSGEARVASGADEDVEFAKRRAASAQAGASDQPRAEALRGPPTRPSGAPAPAASAEPKATAPDTALETRRREMEALQRMIAEKKAERDGALKRQAQARARAESGELEAWRSQINAAFQSILASAKQDAAKDIEVQKTPVAYATRADVQRVLDAPDDYSVLQVQPDTGAAELRRRYRRLAVTLHPDKCATEGASAAFQRLVRAFQNLQDYAR